MDTTQTTRSAYRSVSCLLVTWWNRPQNAELLQDSLGRPDEVVYKLGVDVYVPFVFGAVASVVAEREDPPHLVAEGQGVRQTLEDDVPILGAETTPPEPREREGMRGVVSEIEAALWRQFCKVCISEPYTTRAYEPVEFLLVTRLVFQAADGGQTL
jgi:hypothetical protein